MTLDFSQAKYPPFAHQRTDTETLLKHPFFFIASEMRTGKTKIVIDAAQFLFQHNVIDRLLVIAPEPVRGVWVGVNREQLGGELHEHLWATTPALVTEFHSTRNQWRVGPEERTRELRIVVTNYEYVRPFRMRNSSKLNSDVLKQLFKICGPRTWLVLDESGLITNHKSRTYEACYALRQKCGRFTLMNGTPMDTPIHMFAQGNILHPSVLECKYITHFKNRYCVMGGYKVGAKRKVDSKGRVTFEGGTPTEIVDWKNLDDLQRRFAPYTVRRLQSDCPDMPERLPAVTLRATLTTDTWHFYKTMRDEAVIALSDGASIAEQSITRFMRLSQITGGFLGGIEEQLTDVCQVCYGDGCDACLVEEAVDTKKHVPVVKEIGREKLDVLLWLLQSKFEQEHNAKMVVWCRFSPETQRCIREARERFPKAHVIGLHGGQSKQERKLAKTILHPLTATEGPVLMFVTLGTGSFGFDFSAAHINVNYSYNHSLRKFLQSNDRVYGPRQTRAIEQYDIVAVGPSGQKTYDTAIIQARLDKQDIATWTSSAWVKALSD